MTLFFMLLVGLSSVSSVVAASQTILPSRAAVVYDRPSKFDHSFNQAVFVNGVQALRAKGLEVKEFEPVNGAQTQLGVMKLARRGYSPIIGVGYATAPAIRNAALRYPDVSFVIIDSEIDLPNVQSITFDEDHGAYLAGVLAALSSKSGIIGFVGGMEIPLIKKFSCGFRLGAQSVNTDIEVLRNYVGSTLHAWNDPSKGLELAYHQIEHGVDVIFAAAGGSGLGVYQAAKEHHVLAIGVDSNQNSLHPGTL
ncbi:MAG: BMP family ABC transporter substrate-binding protein, partial [Psychrobium sp.]|nr:BMP family ABC transporter substrate-binding protein [Psychrobium sp.]